MKKIKFPFPEESKYAPIYFAEFQGYCEFKELCEKNGKSPQDVLKQTINGETPEELKFFGEDFYNRMKKGPSVRFEEGESK